MTFKGNRPNLSLGLVLGLLYTLNLSVFTDRSQGVTEFQENRSGFVRSLSELKTSLTLPVINKVEKVELPIRKIKIRALKSKDDERIEPVQIYVPRDQIGLTRISEKLAKPGYQKKIESLLLEKLKKYGPTDQKNVRIDLTIDDLRLMNLSAISDEMAREHHRVIILTQQLMEDPKKRSEFLEQLKHFISTDQRRRIVSKLKKGVNLSLDQDLLPEFPRKMSKKFTIFRGPNCFHAALAFHGQDLTRSPRINIKEEPGYHRAMINYDELWRVINRYFYEVDPAKSPLKYGDMLVFFAAPKDQNTPINFRWIRHTSTYLFGSFTFSKGSKSPNTPYTVKTLQEEWETWQSYTKNLGLKIYRRNSYPPSQNPPPDLIDWIY